MTSSDSVPTEVCHDDGARREPHQATTRGTQMSTVGATAVADDDGAGLGRLLEQRA
jgi:hypothetical protein